MFNFSWIGKLVAALLVAQLLLAPLAGAQQGAFPSTEKPVMENVFFNVVWGSLFGALMSLAVGVVEADRPTAPEDSGQKVFEGATVGGVLGLATGLFLVATGASFDSEQTRLFTQNAPPGHFANSVAMRSAMPFTLETSNTDSFRITGFRATVFNLKF